MRASAESSAFQTVDADGEMDTVEATVQRIYSSICRDEPLKRIESI